LGRYPGATDSAAEGESAGADRSGRNDDGGCAQGVY